MGGGEKNPKQTNLTVLVYFVEVSPVNKTILPWIASYSIEKY